MAKEDESQLSVLMVPFPAQGHLNQLLHLSRLILSNSNNIHIHFASTPTHIRQAKLRIHGWNLLSTSNLHFHQLPIPFFNSPLPNPDSTSNYPSHLQPSFDATIHLRQPISALMKSLSSTAAKRVVVIFDALMGSVVQDSVSIPNVESYSFHSPSAFFTLLFTWERMGKPFPVDRQLLDFIPSMDDCLTPEFQEFINTQSTYFESCVGEIHNTCGIVESEFIELLEKKFSEDNKKLWALGPFNPVKINNLDLNGRHKCLEWLDKQSGNSVLYVSFGTTTSMSDKQIQEIAIGLEKSKQKFLWVVRDADKGDVFDGGETRRIQLPDGFEDNLQEQGFVLRSWAPQLAILGHPATGGFMSHCGWNSCMESITMGVPIAAWPMHSDQPRNAALIAHVLKIGVVVRDWESRNELVTSSRVEDAVRKLMVSEEVGGEMRKRAAELGVAVRSSVEEGGDTHKKLDSFIAYICR